MDDSTWTDDGGDDCSWYVDNDYACGSYGEGAWDACCACGGGMYGNSTWSDSDDECNDDWSWADEDGDDCDYYYDSPSSCGMYGEGAWDACCACNGSNSTDDWDMYYDDDYYYDECSDDWSWVDVSGDDCSWYEENSYMCGSYGEGAWDACCACGGGEWGDWEDDWSDWSDDENIDWEWYLEEASDMLPQDGDSWSIGPVTVTYNDAASKLVATLGAAILATALVQ